MKKRIAVCTNGWSPDVLAESMEGFDEYAKAHDIDIYVFLSFASYSVHKTMMQGELNIYNMCEPSDYDGVIVFSNLLNSDETAQNICMKAKEQGVPVISIGLEFDGITSLGVNNESGMRELMTHLIEVHGVKSIFYMGGTPDHVDSIERLNVCREVLKEHGYDLSDKYIGYGTWANKRTVVALNNFLETGEPLPDAIICANDIMALSVCTELDKKGIRVPEDIIVTGFDNTKNAGIFYPAITTVAQDYIRVAYRACELIYEKCENSEKSKKGVKTQNSKTGGTTKHMVQTKAVFAESCGCNSPECVARRLDYCKKSFQRNTDSFLLEQNERIMRSCLSDVSDTDQLKEKLKRHYYLNHQFEGSAFYLVFKDDYLKKVTTDEKDLCSDKLEGELAVIVGLRDEKLLETDKVDAKKLIPDYQKKDGERHVFYMLPLHYFQYIYGYVVFVDKPYVLHDTMMYPYVEKLMQSIRLLRINLRLQEIYDKDVLTGIYNRTGYENKALSLYKASIEQKRMMTVMFIDINRMKYINDNFGHDAGDDAIKTVASSICEKLEERWIAVRYGGDEFLVIVPDCDEKKAVQVKKDIFKKLRENCAKKNLPYDLTASIGYVTTDPVNRADTSLEEYVKEADDLMYRMKKEMHAHESDRK